MNEQLVSFDTAELAMQKRFDVKCNKIYNHIKEVWKSHYSDTSNSTLDPGAYCTAPTQTILQKWLREVHKIHITVIHRYDITTDKESYDYLLEGTTVKYRNFITWEVALESGLQEALKLIK